MTDPVEPSSAPSAPAPATDGAVAFASFSAAGKAVIGGAAGLIVAIVVGLVVGAWRLDPFGIVMLVLAVIAAGAAWAIEAMHLGPSTRAWPPVILLMAGAIATALAALGAIEQIADLDDMDDYGGVVGLLAGLGALVAAAALLWGAIRQRPVDVRAVDRGGQVAAAGAGLVLLAWVLKLTIGFWAFHPAVWGIFAILLAAILLITAADVYDPRRLAWVSVALGIYAAWVAWGQWGSLLEFGSTEIELGIGDYLPFLVYAAGILLVIGGGLLTALGGMPGRASTPPAPPADPGPTDPPPVTDPPPAAAG